jgi:hypothetical protein
VSRILWTCLAVGLLAISAARPAAQAAAPALPAALDKYMTSVVKVTPAERQALVAGSPLTKLLESDQTKEVAVLGAIWVDAPLQRYVDAVQDIETFESGGGFRVTKKISTPPTLADFAALRLPPDDVEDLRSCRVGDCELKLGATALERLRSEVDWKGGSVQASADASMRRIALEYVNQYLAGGNERLAVYRDSSRPTFVAQELRGMIEGMPELTDYLPEVRRYLLDFPKATLPQSTSFLYWQEAVFGLKPTIRISHLTVSPRPNGTVVASKMIYASHYFWTGLELRALMPSPTRSTGFWFVTVNRSRSDGLSGFTGTVVRGRVRSEVQDGTLAALNATKQRLESQAPR